MIAVWVMLAGLLMQALPGQPTEFVCPMDKDVRSSVPGKCSRCGMTLEAGVREPVEYRLGLETVPRRVVAGKPVELRLELREPGTGKRAVQFEAVHERPFHLFLVGSDLGYFAHEHPEPMGGGRFRLRTTLPKEGIYRVLADCYPTGGTPQLLPAFLTTAGYGRGIGESLGDLAVDLGVQAGKNIEVGLRMEPAVPMAGRQTMLFFSVTPGDGLEQYLGAWGHLLTVSRDLVDSLHEHPAWPEAGREIQFNVFFPREGVYRVWVQFQRLGVVNTVGFTVNVI